MWTRASSRWHSGVKWLKRRACDRNNSFVCSATAHQGLRPCPPRAEAVPAESAMPIGAMPADTVPLPSTSLSQMMSSSTLGHNLQAISLADKRSVLKPKKLIFHPAARVNFLKSKSEGISLTGPDLPKACLLETPPCSRACPSQCPAHRAVPSQGSLAMLALPTPANPTRPLPTARLP